MKSGQILILVLLIVVVVLAVGLSVASRNIINLRTSTQTEHSQRAFTAAEGGVEDVLSRLESLVVNIPTGSSITESVQVGDDITAEVTIKVSDVYESTIGLGSVGQIDLGTDSENLGQVPSGAKIQIEWAKLNSLEVDQAVDGPASIEVTEIFGDGSDQVKYYFQGIDGRSGESGVFNSGACSPSPEFLRCSEIVANANPKILRIKPFWAPTSVRVKGVNNPLPVQTYNVTSTAKTEIGVTRRVQVTRNTLPQLPAVFDYVLFSENDIIK